MERRLQSPAEAVSVEQVRFGVKDNVFVTAHPRRQAFGVDQVEFSVGGTTFPTISPGLTSKQAVQVWLSV